MLYIFGSKIAFVASLKMIIYTDGLVWGAGEVVIHPFGFLCHYLNEMY